jgi:hypothetical protein
LFGVHKGLRCVWQVKQALALKLAIAAFSFRSA